MPHCGKNDSAETLASSGATRPTGKAAPGPLSHGCSSGRRQRPGEKINRKFLAASRTVSNVGWSGFAGKAPLAGARAALPTQLARFFLDPQNLRGRVWWGKLIEDPRAA